MSDLRCPVCDKVFDSKKSPAMPFCSARCKNIDLGRWLDERYGLPYERLHDLDELDRPEDADDRRHNDDN